MVAWEKQRSTNEGMGCHAGRLGTEPKLGEQVWSAKALARPGSDVGQ